MSSGRKGREKHRCRWAMARTSQGDGRRGIWARVIWAGNTGGKTWRKKGRNQMARRTELTIGKRAGGPEGGKVGGGARRWARRPRGSGRKWSR